MHQEDAILYILQWVREGQQTSYPNYGYDIYVPNVLRSYVDSVGLSDAEVRHSKTKELSPIFLDGAWELCRRGVIRPGVRVIGEQSTEEGSAGSGFSITPFGYQWIQEADKDVFIPTEPGRFAEMLQPFKDRFGAGFYIRSQEAVRCYGAHAYYACCAMCGAAAESILLATAIAKTGDEQQVLKDYSASGGRGRIEKMIVGQANERVRREFGVLMNLLKYWRDAASHGAALSITDNEAYTSLAALLRYANFVNDHWDDLTKSP